MQGNIFIEYSNLGNDIYIKNYQITIQESNLLENNLKMDLNIINQQILNRYRNLITESYNIKKYNFNMLHYLKMLKHYIKIKEKSNNVKLLNYLEKILLDKGYDPNSRLIYF